MKNLGKVTVPSVACWIALTILFFYLPVPAGISSFQGNLILFLFMAIYLLLASCLTFGIIKAVLRENKSTLYLSGIVITLLFFVLYIYGKSIGLSLIVSASIQTALLLCGASIAGAALSVAVKRIGELFPVCCTAAIADLMSVVSGPTKGMAEDISSYYHGGMVEPPPFVDSIIFKVGIPGYDVPIPLFGVTDWVLVALLSASLLRLKKSDNILPDQVGQNQYLFFPVSAFALYVSLILARITDLFIPAMVVIVLFFLLYLIVKLKVIEELRITDIAYSVVLPSCVAVLMMYLSG